MHGEICRQIATWLKAKLIETDFRPVPLSHFISCGDQIHDVNRRVVRQTNPFKTGKRVTELDQIAHLCHETLMKGGQVLVFCKSQWSCNRTSIQIAERLKARVQILRMV